MLEKIRFENHYGEALESVKDGIFANYSDLRDYIWDYEANTDKIKSFSRGVVEKTIPLIILCKTEEQGILIRNKLFSIAEKDVLAKIPGKIIVGDYYLSGYIIGSEKANYLYNNKYMETTIKFATNSKYWVKESLFQYIPQHIVQEEEHTPEVPEDELKRTAIENGAMVREFAFDLAQRPPKKARPPLFDLPFDFAVTQGKRTIENKSFSDSNFVMTIYGFVDTPSILIGGHPYTIHTLIYDGERVVIDSAAGTVVKIGRLGEVTNIYNSRGRQYSVFRKIPSGVQTISWPGTYGFDILLKDERSEPEWSL